MLQVQVVGRVQAAREVVTLWLAIPGTLRAPAAYKPGQFITIALPTERGTLYRSYSLCGDGSVEHPWEITIKRQHAGVVSSYIYDRIVPGQILHVSVPVGNFTLPDRIRPGQPLVLVALGSGITPIYGMLRAIAKMPAAARPRVQLHYAYASPADAIYGRDLAQLDPQRTWVAQYHYISSRGNRLTVDQVVSLAGSETLNADWYVCGPGEFKRSIEATLLRRGVPSTRIHAEMFNSPRASTSMAQAFPTGPATVRLADEHRELAARPGETLLVALERNGYHPPFSCRAGACGTCRLRMLSGNVVNGGDGVLSPQERAAGYVLSCVAQPVGEVTLASAAPELCVAAPVLTGERHATRFVLRSALIAASLILFIRAWTFTSQSAAAQSSNPGGSDSSQPSDTGKCSDDDVCATPTPTPSGPSGIFTPPSNQSPPSTSSGSSR